MAALSATTTWREAGAGMAGATGCTPTTPCQSRPGRSWLPRSSASNHVLAWRPINSIAGLWPLARRSI
ncbi:hypothetical protein [Telluria beijingensis]|uniref:hypothetical protein n=1 Tax=Telluria beijingensis TaxID=3068633 RepID=UPI00279537B8|nr:hypothetical protein [Massilia sp. REN29]